MGVEGRGTKDVIDVTLKLQEGTETIKPKQAMEQEQ
jgi:hypothetical protein